MPVTDELLARARAMKRGAAEEILGASFAPVWRIAHGLTGTEAAGRAVAETVLRQSLRVLSTWAPGATPENWFYHHTVLTARGAAQPADAAHDLLVRGASDVDAAELGYQAFVRAWRNLPVQQREAFLLHHGERLNPRMLGVAMDCSTGAAGTHLQAADRTLAAAAGPDFDCFTEIMARAYAALAPPASFVVTNVRRQVSGVRWSARLRRLTRVLVFVAVVAAAAWAGWHWRAGVVQFLRTLHRLDPPPATRPS